MRTYESVLEEIKKNPEKHIHNFSGLQRCCFVGGALDLSLMEAHSQHVDLGTNGGQRCDMVLGPCACGAWHQKSEERYQKILKKYPNLKVSSV